MAPEKVRTISSEHRVTSAPIRGRFLVPAVCDANTDFNYEKAGEDKAWRYEQPPYGEHRGNEGPSFIRLAERSLEALSSECRMSSNERC